MNEEKFRTLGVISFSITLALCCFKLGEHGYYILIAGTVMSAFCLGAALMHKTGESDE